MLEKHFFLTLKSCLFHVLRILSYSQYMHNKEMANVTINININLV